MANKVVLFVKKKTKVIQGLRHKRQEWIMPINEAGQRATFLMALSAVAWDGNPVSEIFLAASDTTRHVPVWVAA